MNAPSNLGVVAHAAGDLRVEARAEPVPAAYDAVVEFA